MKELVFDKEHYLEIDQARKQHLDMLDIDCRGKRLLDVGCGVGGFSEYWAARGAQVLGVDARESNIQVMKERFPAIDAAVANAESEAFLQLGMFDVVFCYGLLYHIENPTLVLRRLAAMTRESLMLETAISVHSQTIVEYVLERSGDDQALNRIACRPSEAYLTRVLAECGFSHIYMPTIWPEHREFSRRRVRAGKGAYGSLVRTILLACRHPLENRYLVPAESKLFVKQMGAIEAVAIRAISRSGQLRGRLRQLLHGRWSS